MQENKLNLKILFGVENRTKYFLHLLIVLSIISIAIFSLLLIGERALNKKPVSAATVAPNPFDDLTLEAKSVMVWDVVNNREIFSKNKDLALPLASLTKVMTALTADSNLPNSLNIKIKEEYLKPEGDSNLLIGDSWEAGDLRDFTLVTSSNDGALALAAVAERRATNSDADIHAQFIKSMNDNANKIGLSNSKFFNEHGLDTEADRGGAYGSAEDMAKLFEYTLKNYPYILEATRYKNLQFESAEKIYSADNTNTSLDQIPGIIASKTGYTDLAGGNLVVAYDAGLNQPIVISVLGSSQTGRFTDTLKLVEAAQKYLQSNL